MTCLWPKRFELPSTSWSEQPTGSDVLDEFSGEEYSVEDLVLSASTPPMLATHRVVVGRGLGRFGAAQLEPLIAWLADPCPTTALVLEWKGGRPPASSWRLPKPRAASASLPMSRAERGIAVPGSTSASLILRCASMPVRVSASASTSAMSWRDWVPPSRRSRRCTGPAPVWDRTMSFPYLGSEGDVPPWDLTDAIDRGDVSATLAALQRMWGAGRHPLQVMANLIAHISRMARLDGADAATEREGAQILGLRGSTFPARKALDGCRRRGTAGIARAVDLLAAADVDLRGRSGLPPQCVTEILCARLAATAR